MQCTMHIQGEHLRRGCDIADYKVLLESVECHVIQLSDTQLTVQLTSLRRLSDNRTTTSQHCTDNDLQLTVRSSPSFT